MDAKGLMRRYEAGERNFRKATLRFQRLREADLAGVDLRESDLTGSNLSGANLSKANLSQADLRGVTLIEANLEHANLHRANLTGELDVFFEKDVGPACLLYADLHKADLSEANLSGVRLSGANLREADLHGANLHRAVLHNAYLHGANLSGADLSKANLTQAHLAGVNFSKADLSEANLDGADVMRRALYAAHTLHEAIMPDGTRFEDTMPDQTGLEEREGSAAENGDGIRQTMSSDRLGGIRGAPLIGCFLATLALIAAILSVYTVNPCCVGFFLITALAFASIAIHGIVTSGGVLTWWKQTPLSHKILLYSILSVLLCVIGFASQLILVAMDAFHTADGRGVPTWLGYLLMSPLWGPFVVVPIGFVVLILLHYVTLFRTVKEMDVDTGGRRRQASDSETG